MCIGTGRQVHDLEEFTINPGCWGIDPHSGIGIVEVLHACTLVLALLLEVAIG